MHALRVGSLVCVGVVVRWCDRSVGGGGVEDYGWSGVSRASKILGDIVCLSFR